MNKSIQIYNKSQIPAIICLQSSKKPTLSKCLGRCPFFFCLSRHHLLFVFADVHLFLFALISGHVIICCRPCFCCLNVEAYHFLFSFIFFFFLPRFLGSCPSFFLWLRMDPLWGNHRWYQNEDAFFCRFCADSQFFEEHS